MNKDYVYKIKKLRADTGISFIKCKNALVKTGWDLYRASLFLKNCKYDKNNNFEFVNQGIISFKISDDKKTGILLEVSCKTDFVSKLSEFKNYVKNITDDLLYNKSYEKNFSFEFKNIKINNNLENDRLNLINKVGENIIIKKVRRMYNSKNIIFGYAHGLENMGRIGTLVLADKKILDYPSLIKDISIQIVSMNPIYLHINDIPQDVLNYKTKEFKNMIKSKNFDKITIQKIINKDFQEFYRDSVLMEQFFVKNTKMCIKNVINNNFKVFDFTRFEVGKF